MTESNPRTAVERIAAFTASARPRQLTDETRQLFKRNILDSIGCAIAALPDSIAKPLLIQRLLVKCLVNAAVAGQVPITGKKRSSRRSKCEQYFVWPHFLQADFWTGITSG